MTPFTQHLLFPLSVSGVQIASIWQISPPFYSWEISLLLSLRYFQICVFHDQPDFFPSSLDHFSNSCFLFCWVISNIIILSYSFSLFPLPKSSETIINYLYEHFSIVSCISTLIFLLFRLPTYCPSCLVSLFYTLLSSTLSCSSHIISSSK